MEQVCLCLWYIQQQKLDSWDSLNGFNGKKEVRQHMKHEKNSIRNGWSEGQNTRKLQLLWKLLSIMLMQKLNNCYIYDNSQETSYGINDAISHHGRLPIHHKKYEKMCKKTTSNMFFDDVMLWASLCHQVNVAGDADHLVL
jgi:hypothetical protein